VTWYDLLSSAGYFGVLELDSTPPHDSELTPRAPALEIKLSRRGEHLVAEWITEDGHTLARVIAGKA
jgi:hypothetical protein